MVILKPRQVSQILNVSVKTLQNWDKEKKLIAFRDKASNRRYYTEEQINQFIGEQDRISNKIVIYTRVSTNSQKPDMDNQVEFLKTYANAKGYIVDEIITKFKETFRIPTHDSKNIKILFSSFVSKLNEAEKNGYAEFY